MAKRPRRSHSSIFKAKVALAAIKGDKTLNELSEHFDVHANQITQWKIQLLERASDAFDGSPKKVRNLIRQSPNLTDINQNFY